MAGTLISSGRMGDFARTENQHRNYIQTSKSLDQARNEATTGLKGLTYKGPGDETHNALTIGQAKIGADQHLKNMSLADQRLGFAETAVTQTTKIMEEFRTRLMGVVQPDNLDASFQKFCKDSLEEIAQILNVQDVGRNNIFGGNEFSTPPVDLEALPVPILGGAVSTSYYKGSQDTLEAPINEGKVLSYGVRADASGFAKALHALKIGAVITPDYQEGSNSMEMLRNAITVAAESTIDLSESLDSVGRSRAKIEAEKDNVNSFLEYADELEQHYIGADITDAWIRFESLKTQLLSIAAVSKMEADTGKDLVTILR